VGCRGVEPSMQGSHEVLLSIILSACVLIFLSYLLREALEVVCRVREHSDHLCLRHSALSLHTRLRCRSKGCFSVVYDPMALILTCSH
jgi:hypothetical protein